MPVAGKNAEGPGYGTEGDGHARENSSHGGHHDSQQADEPIDNGRQDKGYADSHDGRLEPLPLRNFIRDKSSGEMYFHVVPEILDGPLDTVADSREINPEEFLVRLVGFSAPFLGNLHTRRLVVLLVLLELLFKFGDHRRIVLVVCVNELRHLRYGFPVFIRIERLVRPVDHPGGT